MMCRTSVLSQCWVSHGPRLYDKGTALTGGETPQLQQLFSASLLFMCLLCFKDSKAADVKEKGGTLTTVTAWSGRRSARWGAGVTQTRKGAHLPSYVWHTESGDASKSHEHMPPNPWCSHPHSSALRITPMFPGAAFRRCRAPCPTEPAVGSPPCSVLRSRQLAGQPGLPRWLSEHLPALAPSSRVMRRSLAAGAPAYKGMGVPRKAGLGWTWDTKARALKDSAPSSQYGNHPSLRISSLFLFFLSPYPRTAKVTNINFLKIRFPPQLSNCLDCYAL